MNSSRTWAYTNMLPYKTLTISVGVVTYPKDALQKRDLVKKADDAMYYAKKTGKNKICYFDENQIAEYKKEMYPSS